MTNLWIGVAVAAVSASFIAGCGPTPWVENQITGAETSALSGCLRSKRIDWSYRSGDQLPLGESRPGAAVTLFVDFDGGSYSDVSSDPVRSFYDSDTRSAIEKTIEHVAGNYSEWDINVTTDRKAFDRADKRARMLIANGIGASGKASTNGISSSSGFTGYVGSDAVLDPSSSEKCAYVVTHEFGHNFRLRGTTEDYADMHPDATIGAFMGGRDSQFRGYDWIALRNKKGDWQDPRSSSEYMGGIAGSSHGDDDDDYIDNDDAGWCRDGRFAPGECNDNGTRMCRDGRMVESSECPNHHGDHDGITLSIVGNDESPPWAFPLGVCEGDCDGDRDCEQGLRCFQRDGTESVPGCSGTGEKGRDYCYSRNDDDGITLTLVGNDESPSWAFPLGICEGDCDGDRDCKQGLRCFQRDGTESVPGCSGNGKKGRDYCY